MNFAVFVQELDARADDLAAEWEELKLTSDRVSDERRACRAAADALRELAAFIPGPTPAPAAEDEPQIPGGGSRRA